MKKIIFTLLLVASTQIGFAQKDAFKEDIIQFLTISGQKQTFQLMTKDIVDNIPEGKKEAFKADLEKSIDDLMSRMADLYKEEYTHDDIKAFLKFYNSKPGKKLAEKSMVMYEKGQKVGEAWGQSLQEVIMKYIQPESTPANEESTPIFPPAE